jgi:hypothetical protein
MNTRFTGSRPRVLTGRWPAEGAGAIRLWGTRKAGQQTMYAAEVHLFHLSVTVESSLIFVVRFGSSVGEEICDAQYQRRCILSLVTGLSAPLEIAPYTRHPDRCASRAITTFYMQ